MSYKSTPLYGGAITVDLPTGYADASNIRQIPDNQEVWLDSNGYSSIVVDILEYVAKNSDEEALQYHFQDLIDGTGDSTVLLEQARTNMLRTPNKPVYLVSFKQTPAPQPNPPRKKEPEFVAIHLLLLRLKDKGTDIVVTVNIPHYKGEYEEAAKGEEEDNKGVTPLMKTGVEVAKRVLETFEVKDWGLFDA